MTWRKSLVAYPRTQVEGERGIRHDSVRIRARAGFKLGTKEQNWRSTSRMVLGVDGQTLPTFWRKIQVCFHHQGQAVQEEPWTAWSRRWRKDAFPKRCKIFTSRQGVTPQQAESSARCENFKFRMRQNCQTFYRDVAKRSSNCEHLWLWWLEGQNGNVSDVWSVLLDLRRGIIKSG